MAGRPPGRALTALETRYLRLLLDVREQSRRFALVFEERLEDFVLEMLESGASARTMAAALGVSPRTIQRWKRHAEQRRERK